jgi:hypothetical protein
MTTDIERELRELFREKAGEAPTGTFDTSGVTPREVLRRGRRRQVGTVLGSAAIVLVLIVGSVAGLNAVLRGEEDPFTIGDYEVFERTATIEAFTVTSPSDWYLVNEWPLSLQMAVGSGSSSGECTAAAAGAGQPSPVCTSSEPSVQVEPLPHGLPMFQLSNVDMGLDAVSCGQDLPPDAAVLYVGLDFERAIFGAKDPSIGPWPVGLGEPEAADGPCGAGRYAIFSVNGEPFFAWVGFGEGVTDADRSTTLAAYESMTVDGAWEPVPPDDITPAYVIAGGIRANGDSWRLDLRPRERSPELFLEGVDPSFAGVDTRIRHDPIDPAIPIEFCCGWTDGTAGTILVDVTFGFVRKDATAVELEVMEGDELTGRVLPGTIVPMPPSLGSFGSDLFFIPGTAGLAGQVVPRGLEGTESPPSVEERRGTAVELNGQLLGQDWSVRFIGAFSEETACMRSRIADAVGEICPGSLETSLAGSQPSLHSWVTDHLAVFAGSVPLGVAEIRFTSDDGTDLPSQFGCEIGPVGWTDPDKKVCAIALPPEGSGTLQYLDATGAVLFEDGNGWGSATAASPTTVEPVHGGTYWAVYPWVGAAGSREADDVSAWLVQEFGVEAFPGDLACDQGAAEALGTDAEQGIGVYFETADQANAFALQAGLLDHTRRVIARVTTYCLD